MGANTGETTELLQQLIRNRCVNDGTAASGEEMRSVATLESYLGTAGFDLQRYEPFPGRGSLIARIEGSDPSAPSMMLMGHLDVVPVNEANWSRDPFGGELADGYVWGRGAIDMLDKTASMAVAFKDLARSGFRPRGTLVFLAVADEEALGVHGAKWLTENETDAVRVDYVVTEYGGIKYPLDTPGGPKYPVMVAEKGTYWCKLRVRGTATHASVGSFRVDNAVVKAAEVVRRLSEYRPPARLHEVWRGFVDEMRFPDELRDALLDPKRLDEFCELAPVGIGRGLHACTHTTFAPTILSGGVKTNIIPESAEIQVDIRTLPGESADDTRAMLREAIGDLWDDVEVVEDNPFVASASPMDTPMWDALAKATASLVPDAITVPFLLYGATDARYFRKIGIPSYGYGLVSDAIPPNEFAQMFHGDDERVDLETLRLCTELWDRTARGLLG